ncbi:MULTISPECIES: CBASS cGAMP synthase [Methylomonas]|uniref:Cyclic GMP-AMP synthase n=1 Tax=Methylomonas methanica TaxID=421 RepID=A0A177MLN3_METMH|nr:MULTISPECIES: hypothetical protein [Methylomonas]OAI06696.1 hypothetical protein A1353_00085 [Methylomonas methanica]PKM13735.1 MAG: hypothetical protein CVV13_00635 [Gammaproteobacteria bacterium HGW-Gammaproteobacteria-3]QBC26571.1 hypothetical protein U737_06395 [Methylomonas sp. LW13]
MLKLNKLFFYADEKDVFNEVIRPSQEQRDYLVSCKNDIRDHLRPRIKEATRKILNMDKSVEPRFRTQGSWSYKTCIQPAYSPHQEMDWDYGVYLPVAVWEQNGPPHAMAKLYFDLVERLLYDLCKSKGWELQTGKSTCIRIQVANWAHIDIPLYAAPEHKFNEIVEKSLALLSIDNRGRSMVHDSAFLSESAEFGEIPEQVWEDLDDIMMATRSGEWKASDPEAVSRWFNDRVEEHGEQLRRVCCYLKAWRDYHWKDGGGPTSVSIMIAIAQAFKPNRGRDDLVLESSAEHLSNVILGEIREFGIDEGAEDFNNRLSNVEKTLAAQRAKQFVQAIRMARSYEWHMKHQAITELQNKLGERIPYKHDWVEVDNGADEVRTTPPQRVSQPVVRRTKAG